MMLPGEVHGFLGRLTSRQIAGMKERAVAARAAAFESDSSRGRK